MGRAYTVFYRGEAEGQRGQRIYFWGQGSSRQKSVVGGGGRAEAINQSLARQ